MTASVEPQGTGDCFSAAVDAARLFRVEDPKICHGRPIGTGPENGGRRYWHAWVEVRRGGVWWVHDHSNGKRIAVPRAVYYQIGQIVPNRVHRYRLHRAYALMGETGIYGPWVPGWEEYPDDKA